LNEVTGLTASSVSEEEIGSALSHLLSDDQLANFGE
jgi:hypothetical protein